MTERKLIVLLYGAPIGSLAFDGGRIVFKYDGTPPHPLSLSLPTDVRNRHEGVRFKARHFSSLPHYFENLLPEGWLLDVAKSMKIEANDKLDYLYALCRDTLGAVSFAWNESESLNSTLADALSASTNSTTTASSDSAIYKPDFPLFCLRCAKRLPHRGYNSGFHEACAQEFFGASQPPKLNVQRQNLREVAEEHLSRGESITGSQEKFSLKYKIRDRTIMLPGFSYIVKPRQSEKEIHDLPRMEHVVMTFAAHLGLGVAETAIVILADGTDAFITKRFDRTVNGGRIHVEDMSQATGEQRGSEGEYLGSMELIAEQLSHPLVDEASATDSRRRLLQSTLFNFLFGNTDAHLKNHSIIWQKDANGRYRFNLAPFYDLVPCRIYANDLNELGLKLDGKNSGFTAATFERFAEERLHLRSAEVRKFVVHVKSERGRLVELLEGYEIAGAQITKLMDLAGERIRRLDGRATKTAGHDKVAHESFAIDEPTKHPALVPQSATDHAPANPGIDPTYCQSKICKNPKGRTVLKGTRRKSGFCSYCSPEV